MCAPFLNWAAFGSVGAPLIITIVPGVGRAGLVERVEQGLALQLADLLVVEGDVVVNRAAGETVVGDHRDVLGLGLVDDACGRLGVDRVEDQDVDALGQHRLGLLTAAWRRPGRHSRIRACNQDTSPSAPSRSTGDRKLRSGSSCSPAAAGRRCRSRILRSRPMWNRRCWSCRMRLRAEPGRRPQPPQRRFGHLRSGWSTSSTPLLRETSGSCAPNQDRWDLSRGCQNPGPIPHDSGQPIDIQPCFRFNLAWEEAHNEGCAAATVPR